VDDVLINLDGPLATSTDCRHTAFQALGAVMGFRTPHLALEKGAEVRNVSYDV
jgi:hypothetical protein